MFVSLPCLAAPQAWLVYQQPFPLPNLACRPGLGGLQGAAGTQAAALGAQQRLGAAGGLGPSLQQLGLGQTQAGRVGVPAQQYAGVNGEDEMAAA